MWPPKLAFQPQQPYDQLGELFLAVDRTKLRNCLSTGEGSLRREANPRNAFGAAPCMRRYTIPAIRTLCIVDGTKAIPSPAATRLRVDVIRGAG
jgi:hypothetical protein